MGDKTSKYPHNPITIKEIEFIKLAIVAFIFFYKNKDFGITYAIKKQNCSFFNLKLVLELEIYQIDAFTSEVFRGNPACVVP